MSRIFDSRGLVVIDYDKVEIQIEAHLAAARAAGCRWITVDVPKDQLLYLGNRNADALAAIKDSHCKVYSAGSNRKRKLRRGRS